MALIEKQIVFKRKSGENVEMHLPTTKIEYVEGGIKTVNGVAPDANKNVAIDVGVKTVNNIAPDENGNVNVVTILLDTFYPVGSFYETDNADFDPNTAWGGTWEKLRDGRVLIAESDTYVAGTTGGAATVTLTTNQIPSHTHTASSDSQGAHTHSRGTMNIAGSLGGHDNATHNGAFSYSGNVKYLCGHSHSGGANLGNSYFNAANNWSGSTSSNGAHSHTITVNNTGGGAAHNNMQPYLAVYRWHRTA